MASISLDQFPHGPDKLNRLLQQSSVMFPSLCGGHNPATLDPEPGMSCGRPLRFNLVFDLPGPEEERP